MFFFSANYKNLLIQFTQRANIALPEYRTQNEGASHAPEFRCSVLADGLVFTLPNTFFHIRAAEQEVSRVALVYLVKKIKDEGRSIISKSVTFCKGVLNEYAKKLNVKPPTYNTVEYKKVIPYFVCTMDFNCTSYIGEAARRKKDAEDLAARAAILSILDNSDSGIMLGQMIKAKAMLFNSVQLKTLLPTCDNVIVSVEKTALSCELVQGLKDENKGIADPADNDNTNKIETARSEPGLVVSTHQRPEMPMPEPAPEAAKSPNGSQQPEMPIPKPAPEAAKSPNGSQQPEMPIPKPAPEAAKSPNGSLQREMPIPEPAPEAAKSPNGSQQPDSALPIDNAVSARKRRRNNYRANKKARMQAELKALSSGEVHPLSVAQ
ncbi:hypothetical protein KIW84_021359 [Lathyrus oleraceus]|uniref:DRBM domain-containing protein n=1 Tax=Pisum sativum TaxID=3888 RepID=A0A9D5B3V8_PEA|nr:hypothetical protein KIW84_021359 [Pisum sativum]